MYSVGNIACEQALRVSGEPARGVPAVTYPLACFLARVLLTIFSSQAILNINQSFLRYTCGGVCGRAVFSSTSIHFEYLVTPNFGSNNYNNNNNNNNNYYYYYYYYIHTLH